MLSIYILMNLEIYFSQSSGTAGFLLSRGYSLSWAKLSLASPWLFWQSVFLIESGFWVSSPSVCCLSDLTAFISVCVSTGEKQKTYLSILDRVSLEASSDVKVKWRKPRCQPSVIKGSDQHTLRFLKDKVPRFWHQQAHWECGLPTTWLPAMGLEKVEEKGSFLNGTLEIH